MTDVTDTAPAGPAALDDPDTESTGRRARLGREVADFVERYRDGYPQKIASTGTAMVHTTYALADGDQATDAAWSAAHDFHSDVASAPGIAMPASAEPRAEMLAVKPVEHDVRAPYNGRGTEPHAGRSMAVIDGREKGPEPRDPLHIVDFGGVGPMTHLGICAICDPDQSTDVMDGVRDGTIVFADGPGSARSALAGHLRRVHDRSPWPGER